MADKPLTEQEVRAIASGVAPADGVQAMRLAQDWLRLQERLAEAERERDGARMVGASWHGEWFNEAGRREVAEGQLAEARAALEGALSSRVISVDNPEWAPPWVEKARDALAAMESDAGS